MSPTGVYPRLPGAALADRFRVRVDERGPDECWEWQGRHAGRGYGYMRIDGHERGAHRVAWEVTNGPIPEGMCVLHRCDNPPCVNLAHLFLGTHADNMADMRAKGRDVPPPLVLGERAPQAILTERDVRTIRERAAAGESGPSLAREFGVRCDLISRVLRRETWRHVA